MILSFKTKFPNGTPTNFKEKILAGEKIHTLREDEHNRWHKGRKIEMATGVRTPLYSQFNCFDEALQTCTGTQDVFMTYWLGQLEITINGKYVYDYNVVELLIKNDGLTESEFIDWFFPNENNEWSGKIIHWTDFRY